MLVLTRKVGQTIVIDDEIHVTVVALKGDSVRLGITAPAAVLVDRSEIHEHRGDRAEHTAMPRRVVAFDVDRDSMACLRQALPGWEVNTASGATTGSLARDWDPAPADLLVIGARAGVAESLGLCRELRSQRGRAHTPLVILVATEQEAEVRAGLRPGADTCLVLPVRANDLLNVVARSGQAIGPTGSRIISAKPSAVREAAP